MQVSLLVLCALTIGTYGELFSSIGQMEDLIHEEFELIGTLRDYLYMEENRLKEIKKWLQELEEGSMAMKEDVEGFLSHPINQYKLMARSAVKWQKVDQAVRDNHARDMFIKHFNEVELPDEVDIEEAANAIMRLQDTYALTSNELANGLVKGSVTQKLTMDEAFFIGMSAYEDRDYYHCALWLNEARKKNLDGEDDGPNLFEILDHLSFCLAQQGNFQAAYQLTQDMLQIDSSHAQSIGNYYHYEKIVNARKPTENGTVRFDNMDDQLFLSNLDKDESYEEYERLCRYGSDPIPREKVSELICFYWTNEDPWLLIQPVKAEMMWTKPNIIRFYEVISDQEIDVIKSMARPNLDRSTVIRENKNDNKNSKNRISKVAWISQHDSEIAMRLTKRISTITGLSMETAEKLQIANYGIGGQYEPHFDFNSQLEGPLGNRIATWMFYFSDVMQGGDTVFVKAKVTVKPVKGSAVFWYNLLPSGRGDERTLHGACPVLLGIKWAGNQWIRARGQEFRKKCGLNVNSEF